jgi:hypothetical protein
MNTVTILLICGSNLAFLICGYKLGNAKQIITIEKGDKVKHVEKEYNDYPDEEASFVTPEMEQVYEAYIRKKGGIDGMET